MQLDASRHGRGSTETVLGRGGQHLPLSLSNSPAQGLATKGYSVTVLLSSPPKKGVETWPLSSSQNHQRLWKTWILLVCDEDVFLELWWE